MFVCSIDFVARVCLVPQKHWKCPWHWGVGGLRFEPREGVGVLRHDGHALGVNGAQVRVLR